MTNIPFNPEVKTYISYETVKFTIYVCLLEEDISLQLKATRGPDAMRFVAVDDVTVSKGHCISEYLSA